MTLTAKTLSAIVSIDAATMAHPLPCKEKAVDLVFIPWVVNAWIEETKARER